MNNSEDTGAPSPEDLNYQDLDSDIREIIEEPKGETKEFQVKVGYDGKQNIIRVPREISESLDIQQGDHIKFTLAVNPQNPKENKLKIEYPKLQ